MVLLFSTAKAQNGVAVNNELNNVLISPNPATSLVNFKFNQSNKVAYVAIYSIIGNEVLNKKVDQSNNFKLNVQNLKKGKYIVRVFNVDGSTESLSLIKN
jgi:hypothetical protein